MNNRTKIRNIAGSGLKHLSNWPYKKSVSCYASRLNFRIDEQGVLYSCDERYGNGESICKLGLEKAISALRTFSCSEC